MANTGMCVAAIFLVIIVAVQSARLRRSEYLFDSLEDASIAGDHIITVGADCSDDDSSESLELGYVIINKREAPVEPRGRSTPAQIASSVSSGSQPLPNPKSLVFA